jgi:hypothetical protein
LPDCVWAFGNSECGCGRGAFGDEHRFAGGPSFVPVTGIKIVTVKQLEKTRNFIDTNQQQMMPLCGKPLRNSWFTFAEFSRVDNLEPTYFGPI